MTNPHLTAIFQCVVGVFRWLLPTVIGIAACFLVLEAASRLATSGTQHLLLPDWNPGGRAYGVTALVLCTLFAALPATLLAVLLGMPCALHMALRRRGRLVRLAKLSVGVWYGVPSVVVGLLVLATLTPSLGFSLSAGIVAIFSMVFPGFVLSAEALVLNADHSCHQALKAHGVGPFGCLYHGLLPEVRGEAGALVLLTLARGLGEATAVSLVIGGVVTSVPPTALGATEFLAPAVLKGFPVATGDYMTAVAIAAAVLLGLVAACAFGAARLRLGLVQGGQTS